MTWIKVEGGQLPRGDGDVIVATITGHVITAHPSRIRALHSEAQQTGEDCFYTHWMPLPSVPHDIRGSA